MKRALLLTALLILIPFSIGWTTAIVSDGNSSEDSLSLSITITDSLGNPSHTHADSFFVSVIGPSGDSVVAFEGTAGAAGLHIDSLYSALNGWSYVYSDAVANIAGEGRVGVYELRLCAKDSNPEYVNCSSMRFQVASSNLSVQFDKISQMLDSLFVIIDSINTRPDAETIASKAVDTINARQPSVNIASISADVTAADNLESMLDGTGGSKLTLGQLIVDGSHADNASLYIRNTAGDAVVFESSGGGGSGLWAIGSVAGEGIKGTGGGMGGQGIQGIGGIGGSDIAGDIGGSIYGQVYGNLYGFATPTDTNRSGNTLARVEDSSAFQGEASGLSKAQIADTLIKAGMVRYSEPDSVLNLRGLHIVGTTPGDTALVAIGSGSGHGAYFGSNGTGHGGYFRGGLTSGNGIIAWTNNGYGMALFGSRDKSGLYCEATDSGAGAFFMGGDEASANSNASGLRIRGRVDDGVYVSAGMGENKHGIQIDGGTGTGGDAIRILGKGAGGGGISISAEDGELIDVFTRGEIAGSIWGSSLDSAWAAGSFGDSAKSWSASSPLGGGLHPVTITTFDSSGMQSVPGVRISVSNTSGETAIAMGLTDENGQVRFNLDAGNYRVAGFAPGYLWEGLDTLTITGAAADSMIGYRFYPGNPSSPDLCRVFGFLYGIDGLPIEGATVSAELIQSGARLNALIISPFKKMVITDSTGYFALDMIPSSKMTGIETNYMITVGYPAGTVLHKQITVPDVPTWELTW